MVMKTGGISKEVDLMTNLDSKKEARVLKFR